jgi:Uma2 family endonuclease
MLPDGATVRVSRHAAHEPDALVYCGPKLPRNAIEVPERGGGRVALDAQDRRVPQADGYFSLASVQHYLIVDPDGPPVLHHRRQGDGTILTSIVHDGVLTLSPPGIEMGVPEIFAAT